MGTKGTLYEGARVKLPTLRTTLPTRTEDGQGAIDTRFFVIYL